MQVLQLTDEQVALLPAEQQQSIFVLKDQIAKSAKRSISFYIRQLVLSRV